jgi:hypothetical protein
VKYWTRTLIGLAITLASLVAVNWGLYHLVRTGSCASGGPYVSARPCPPGTGGHIGALIGGIFGGLIGMAVYATRGDRGRRGAVGLGLAIWSLGFVTIAASSLVAGFGPAADDRNDSKTGAIILAAIFVPLGLAPLPFARARRGKAARALELVTHGRRCPGRVLSVEDTGVTINDNPQVKMVVQAEPPGEPPFTVEKKAIVSRLKIPRAGDRCTVFYDPADRESTGITFDPVPLTGPIPSAPAPPGPTEGDALEGLRKLGELRAAGVLTEAEFEDQKRRLLGEL